LNWNDDVDGEKACWSEWEGEDKGFDALARLKTGATISF